MEGLVVSDIITYQQEYFDTNHQERNITSWTKTTYKPGWNLIMDIWTHRNEVLHKSENIDILNRKDILEEAIFLNGTY